MNKKKPVSLQLVEHLGEDLDITISSNVVYALHYEYLELQKENEMLHHYKLLYQKVKERNDETIKYIGQHSNSESEYLDIFEVKELLEILKGNNEVINDNN